jgi:hypothetical protein
MQHATIWLHENQSASTTTGLLGRRPLQHLDIELDGRLQVREELSFKSLLQEHFTRCLLCGFSKVAAGIEQDQTLHHMNAAVQLCTTVDGLTGMHHTANFYSQRSHSQQSICPVGSAVLMSPIARALKVIRGTARSGPRRFQWCTVADMQQYTTACKRYMHCTTQCPHVRGLYHVYT